ncbi:UNVERIFIED_CONTAM: hypothetical protein RMT77_015721 [Armadillidium vulgare]
MLNVIRAKCLVIGDACTGKSCLVHSFLGDASQHLKNYHMTLGAEIHQKQVRIPDTNTAIQLFFFDMSGKEFHKSLMKKMSEQTSLVLLVYDVTSEESFVMAENLYQEVQKINGEIPVKGILFGNKTDLVNRRRVTPKTGNELAKKLGLTYFEGSGKEQQGIDTPLFFLANEWYKIYTERTNILKEFT